MSNTRNRAPSTQGTTAVPGDAVPNTGKATAHVDTFAREHLPRVEMWPVMTASALSDLDYPDRLNAAVELLDRKVEQGLGRRPCLRTDTEIWSYEKLLDRANRIA